MRSRGPAQVQHWKIGHILPKRQSGVQACKDNGNGQLLSGFRAGIQGRGIHSRDLAVGSRDHPVRTDERTTAEVEAGVILERHLPGPGAWHCILPVDNSLIVAQCRRDGRNTTAPGGAKEDQAKG